MRLIALRLKWFVDEHLMSLQYEFELNRVTCCPLVIIFVNRVVFFFFFLVHSENELQQSIFRATICVIRFRFRFRHRRATDTFQKLQIAYGDSIFSRAQVFGWFKADGRESIKDEPLSGKHSTAKITKTSSEFEILSDLIVV